MNLNRSVSLSCIAPMLQHKMLSVKTELKKKNALRNTFASCQSLSLDVCVFIRCEAKKLKIRGYLNWLVMKYEAVFLGFFSPFFHKKYFIISNFHTWDINISRQPWNILTLLSVTTTIVCFMCCSSCLCVFLRLVCRVSVLLQRIGSCSFPSKQTNLSRTFPPMELLSECGKVTTTSLIPQCIALYHFIIISAAVPVIVSVLFWVGVA